MGNRELELPSGVKRGVRSGEVRSMQGSCGEHCRSVVARTLVTSKTAARCWVACNMITGRPLESEPNCTRDTLHGCLTRKKVHGTDTASAWPESWAVLWSDSLPATALRLNLFSRTTSRRSGVPLSAFLMDSVLVRQLHAGGNDASHCKTNGVRVVSYRPTGRSGRSSWASALGRRNCAVMGFRNQHSIHCRRYAPNRLGVG